MSGDVVHRVGAMACAAAGVLWLVAAAGAVAAWLKRRSTLRRLDAVVGGTGQGTGRGRPSCAPRPSGAAGALGPVRVTRGAAAVGRRPGAPPAGTTSAARPTGAGVAAACRGTDPVTPAAGPSHGAVTGGAGTEVALAGEVEATAAVGGAAAIGALSPVSAALAAAAAAGGDARDVTVAAGEGAAAHRGARSAHGGRAVVRPGPRSVRGGRAVLRGWLLVAGAVCAGYVLVEGALGGLLGVLCGIGVWWWQRRPVSVAEFDVDHAVRELPLAADLLAACVAAGADPVTAARVVGEALAGPVGRRLAWGAAEVRLGGEPAEAWRRLAELPGARPLARLLERAGDSGAPAAVPVARLAAAARAERGRAATARARRAGVLITAPVGLCFLPAFITVGIVPVLIGLASGLLSGSAG